MELRNHQVDSIKSENDKKLGSVKRAKFFLMLWNKLKWLMELTRWPILGLISIYQRTLSPDHGLLKRAFPNGYCKFYPSCSEYGYQAIKKYGVIRGGVKAIWRIIRCNPWSDGGVDKP